MKRRIDYSVLAAVLTLLGGHFAMATTALRVTGDRVALRAAPDINSEAVSQVSKGSLLTAEGALDQAWVQIRPPSDVGLWVHRELIVDGTAGVSRVQVRSGPGINYRPVGKLDKGAPVVVRGAYNDWLRIAPPPGSTLWISRKYVEPLTGMASTSGPEVASGENGGTVVGAAPAPETESPRPPAASLPAIGGGATSGSLPASTSSSPRSAEGVAGLRLVASKQQGKVVQVQGVLRPSGGLVWHRPSKYRLVHYGFKGRAATRCYVMGDASRMESLMGHMVQVSGKEYWVQGVRYPVVVPDQILSTPL